MTRGGGMSFGSLVQINIMPLQVNMIQKALAQR